jgi:hypothetical protein
MKYRNNENNKRVKKKNNEKETPAVNEHIGSMAALPPLEKMYEIEHLSPAGKCLEAATAPICQNVGRNRRVKCVF